MKQILVTDEWLYKYMPIVDEAIMRELEKKTNYEYEFSDKFENKMDKLIKKEARSWRSIFISNSKKYAIFILCIFSLLFLLSMSAHAYRIKFFETVKTMWADSILYSYFTDTDIVDFQINELKYIPEGYKEIERIVTDKQFSVIYENIHGEIITWDQVLITDEGSLIIDLEYDSQIVKEINGSLATISLYSDGYTGVYYEFGEYAYMLTVEHLSIDEICAMIESIK